MTNAAAETKSAVDCSEVLGSGRRRSAGRFAELCLWLFIGGSIGNSIAYFSLTPVLVAATAFVCLTGTLHVLHWNHVPERRAAALVFCTSWFWAGISAMYAAFADDPTQNHLDAAYFYALVTESRFADQNLTDLVTMNENGGAMLIWRLVYDAAASLSLDRGRYIGICVNIYMVALTSVVAVRTIRIMFPQRYACFHAITVLFATCGMLWLFAAIHLRDAATLLSVSWLCLIWVRYLVCPDSRRLAQAAVATVVSLYVLGSLRAEFSFVPVALLIAAVAAAIISSPDRRHRARLVLFTLVLAAPAGAYLLASIHSDLALALATGQDTYNTLSAAEGDGASLGNAMIVNQPLYIRLLVGSIYVLAFPVPFWSGFQLDSSYHLFKSFHVLFMYVVIPMVMVTVARLWREPKTRTAPLTFLFFVTLGFLLAIAYTSLENRHFGTFLMAPLILAAANWENMKSNRTRLRNLYATVFAGIAAVHGIWFVLKMGG